MIPKGAEKAFAEHFEIPREIWQLAAKATWDLWNAPLSEGEDEEDAYPGFTSACDQVGDWCDLTLSDVWYDTQSGFVSDREPEGYKEECADCAGSGEACFHDADPDEECPTCQGSGEVWVEPEWQDYYRFELRDVKRALFDTELCAYILKED